MSYRSKSSSACTTTLPTAPALLLRLDPEPIRVTPSPFRLEVMLPRALISIEPPLPRLAVYAEMSLLLSWISPPVRNTEPPGLVPLVSEAISAVLRNKSPWLELMVNDPGVLLLGFVLRVRTDSMASVIEISLPAVSVTWPAAPPTVFSSSRSRLSLLMTVPVPEIVSSSRALSSTDPASPRAFASAEIVVPSITEMFRPFTTILPAFPVADSTGRSGRNSEVLLSSAPLRTMLSPSSTMFPP